MPGRLCLGQIAVRLHQPEHHLPSFLAPAPAPREERGRRDRVGPRDHLADRGHGGAQELPLRSPMLPVGRPRAPPERGPNRLRP